MCFPAVTHVNVPMNQPDETEANQDTGGGPDDARQEPGDGSDTSADSTGATAPPGSPRESKSGGGTAFIALLIALLVAAGTGYQWFAQRGQGGLNEQIAGVRADINAAEAARRRLTDDVNSIADDSRRIDAQLDTLSAGIEGQLRDLPLRIAALEQTVETLPGVAGDARSAWLRAEVEYLLRIANVQLNLAGNVDAALKALELADQKLGDLATPGLTRVRSLLSDERAALASVPRPDLEGIVLALGSLARTLDTLPLAESAPGRFGHERNTDASESGLQRAWRVIVDALRSIISVKRNDEPVTPLMSQSDQSMLIRGLDMELQIARLAVIRNEARLYQGALQAVAARLEQYFDTNAADVQTARNTIDELLQAELPETLPDISASLALLMRLNGQDRAR